jgi:hypothetical protein
MVSALLGMGDVDGAIASAAVLPAGDPRATAMRMVAWQRVKNGEQQAQVQAWIDSLPDGEQIAQACHGAAEGAMGFPISHLNIMHPPRNR